jgi:hypothetical protein
VKLGGAALRLRASRRWDDRSGRLSGFRIERRPLGLISEAGAILGVRASANIDRIEPVLGFLAAGDKRRLICISSDLF